MNAPAKSLPATARTTRPLARSLHKSRLRMYLVLQIGDLVCILAGFYLAGGLYLGQWPARVAMLQGQLLLPVFATIALYQGAYSLSALANLKFALRRGFLALIVSSALLIFITFYTKSTTSFSRGIFTLALLFIACGMSALRVSVIAWIRRHWGASVSNILVIQDGGPPVRIARAMYVDAAHHGLVPDPTDPNRLDRLGGYLLNMDRVVVSCPPERRADWAFVLKAAGVRGEILSENMQRLRPIGIETDGQTITFVVSNGPLGMRARATKRIFDLAFAMIALALALPIMLLVALAIRLEDGGPVLFVQRRLGRGNRFFQMLKFRSMREESGDADGACSTALDDGRVTRVGRFLRRTSLDELPQLFNVLRGEMSIVGPRPHALGSQAGSKLFWEIDDAYWHRHALRPGLTGLAQVRGLRGATDLESDLRGRLEADLEYIRSWSPLQDCMIIARTLRVVVHQKAY